MTAKELVLEHAPHWTERQAERALAAAEGRQISREDRLARHRAVMERAAALRARQTETVDAAALIREARDELERRGA